MEFPWRNWNQRGDDHGKLQRGESIKPYTYPHINTCVYFNANAYADSHSNCHVYANSHGYSNCNDHTECNSNPDTERNRYSHCERNA